MTEPRDLLIWHQSPGGRTCQDSNGLDEQVDAEEGWRTHVYPGAVFTKCRGKCDCILEPAPEGMEITLTPYRVFGIGASPPPRRIGEGKMTALLGVQVPMPGPVDPTGQPPPGTTTNVGEREAGQPI